MAFVDFVERFPLAVESVQKKWAIRLVVVANKKSSSYKRFMLLYDGRHGVLDNDSNEEAPLCCFVIAKNKKLQLETNKVDNLPRLHCNNFRSKSFGLSQIPLWQFLVEPNPAAAAAAANSNAKGQKEDPQDLKQLHAYVEQFRPPKTKVYINYVTGIKKNSQRNHWYENPQPVSDQNPQHPLNMDRVVCLEARSGPDYTITYSMEHNPSVERSFRHFEKMTLDAIRFQFLMTAIEKQKQGESHANNPFQANNSTAVSVKRTGLNLAYDLGLITREELTDISNRLADTYGSLFLFLDDRSHLRHITYCDRNHTFHEFLPCFEYDCYSDYETYGMTEKQEDEDNKWRDKASKTMSEFFVKIWHCRTEWVNKRQDILQPLIDRLQTTLNMDISPKPRSFAKAAKKTKKLASPYLNCLNDIKKVVHSHRLLLCSERDSHLHSLKFFLGHFAYQTFPQCRGVAVKASTDSTLISLAIPGLTIFNLNTYFDSQSDLDFYAPLRNPWVGPIPQAQLFDHHKKLVQFQAPVHMTLDSPPLPLSLYCRQRGFQFAKFILTAWIQFGQFVLSSFLHEVHGQTSYVSASYLAFQCVWSKYTLLAGHLAQPVERTKHHHEILLREHSRGGFMYSIRDAINQGDILIPSTQGRQAEEENQSSQEDHYEECMEPSDQESVIRAQAIAEWDIISSYGHSATQSHLPAGFCTGYKKLNPNDSHLTRVDNRARHRSFEFRAVYKTLDDMTRKEGIKIRTAYHNYSPRGIFNVGKFPLDLAVITEDYRLILVQFDGNYCHSCPKCPINPDRPCFVNGQTHEQVRKRSEKRDAVILSWANAVNDATKNISGGIRVSYEIIYDCHSLGMTTDALESSFKTEPILAQLVKGYAVSEKLGRSFTVPDFQRVISAGWGSSTALHADSFTFIAKASVTISPEKGHCSKEADESLIVFEPLSEPNRPAQQKLASKGSVLLTRDYYDWLSLTYGDRFQLNDLEWVLFYKSEKAMNQVYGTLTQMRAATSRPLLATFLKRLINVSAGFMGARSSPTNKTTFKIVRGLPKNYAPYRHHIDFDYRMNLDDSQYYVLETKPWPKVPHPLRQTSKSALPMFVTIVEYGKLRIIQILRFLLEHVKPGWLRICYGNVDNSLCVIGNADTLEEAIDPQKWSSFTTLRSQFLNESPLSRTPGLAELKWIRNGPCGWKFVTVRTQHYCLILPSQEDNDPSAAGGHLHKTSGLSGLSSVASYYNALKMLQKQPVSIPQMRRTNKRFNVDTKQVVFEYK